MYIWVSEYKIFLKSNKFFIYYFLKIIYIFRKKERKKEGNVRSLMFLLKSLKKEKIKVKMKERKNGSYDSWLATSKEKGKESRQVVGKTGWRLNGTVSLVFEFVSLAMYHFNLHWQ